MVISVIIQKKEYSILQPALYHLRRPPGISHFPVCVKLQQDRQLVVHNIIAVEHLLKDNACASVSVNSSAHLPGLNEISVLKSIMSECDTAIKLYEENPLIMKSGADVSFHFSCFTHKERCCDDYTCTVRSTTSTTTHCPQQSSTVQWILKWENAFHTDWLDAEVLLKGG